MIVALYVDDIIIASNDNDFKNKFIRKLQDNFDIRDMGIPKDCIGLEVDVKDGEISISQPGYISNITKKYGLDNCKPVKIPMQANIKLEKEPTISVEAEKVDEKLYQFEFLLLDIHLLLHVYLLVHFLYFPNYL